MTEDEMLREIARLKAHNDKLRELNASLHNEFGEKLQKAFEKDPSKFKIVNLDEIEGIDVSKN